jgi:hypothetical protein
MLQRRSKRALALACVFAWHAAVVTGCESPPERMVVNDVDGFRVTLAETRVSTSSTPTSGRTSHRVSIQFQIDDLLGDRDVTASRSARLTEALDEWGRDLLAPAEASAAVGDRQRIAFPAFMDRTTMAMTPSRPLYSTARIDDLPDRPHRLNAMRGECYMLVAKRFSTHDVRVETMEQWRELSQGLSIRITSIDPLNTGRTVRFEVRSEPTLGPLSDAQWVRWYAVQTLDAKGAVVQDIPGLVNQYNTDVGLGTGMIPIDLEPDAARVEALRITTVDELQITVIPFDFRDVPLK